MARQMVKIPIRCQHRQIVANAELREQGVDRPDLNAGAPTFVAKARRLDMILAIGRQQWEGGESFQQRAAGFRSLKPLQQFLEHQAGHYDSFAAVDCLN